MEQIAPFHIPGWIPRLDQTSSWLVTRPGKRLFTYTAIENGDFPYFFVCLPGRVYHASHDDPNIAA